jgi:hypothetical protein
MRRSAAVSVIGVLIAGMLILVAPPGASAAAVSATATGATLAGSGSCGPNPQMLISGSGVGDGFGEDGWVTLGGEASPEIAIVPSPLFDDWSFTSSSFGLVPSSVPGEGDLVAGYAVIGNADQTVAAEWFVMWRCGAGADSGALVHACWGPLFSCPRSVDEAVTLIATVTPSSAAPGGTFTVSIRGCAGGEVAAGLWVPMTSDPVVSTGPIATDGSVVEGTLTVPAGAAATDAQVVVVCSLDPADVVVIPVQILAEASGAAPVEAAPAFTG